MNIRVSLNTYRASDPSITISDAQAQWVLKWAEQELATQRRIIFSRYGIHEDYVSRNILEKEFQLGREKALAEIKNNVGFLRQWLNERPYTINLVTNEDILYWLFLQSTTEDNGQDVSPTEKKCCDECACDFSCMYSGPKECHRKRCLCHCPACHLDETCEEHEEHHD